MLMHAGVCLAGLLSALTSQADPPKDDVQAIQGRWKVVDSQHNGKPYPEMMDARFVFANGQVTVILIEEGKENAKRPWPFKLDHTKSPKWIDLGPELGVYSLDGDDLRICFGDTRVEGRTTKFESVPNSSAYLLKLRREKP
jgi:uncharacterized protein (TIGR03067 family)